MESYIYGDEPRAEEVIAEIYRQIQELRATGKEAHKVCLPVTYIRRLRIYHALLGSTSEEKGEYLQHDGIFGLEFFVHPEKSILVC